MKKNVYKFFAVFVLFSAFLANFSLPSYANSAQKHWEGIDSRGCIVISENCPIQVTSEVLTFDISELSIPSYSHSENDSSYTPTVTAEYTFHNPADYTVTAKLAFPFGNISGSEYFVFDNERGWVPYSQNTDTDKYCITVNDEKIEKNVRHTLSASNQFNITEDLLKLSDEYLEDDFITPTTAITRYSYIIGGENLEGKIDSEKYKNAYVAFDWEIGDGNSKLFAPGFYEASASSDGKIRFYDYATNGKKITIYVFGDPLSEPPVLKCYESRSVNDSEQMDGLVSLVEKSTKTMTFEEFVFEGYSEKTNVSPIDWYNAALCSFKSSPKNALEKNYYFTYVYQSGNPSDFISRLMRWYEYEITLNPGESIKNTVTAPLSPDVNAAYEPPIFSFTYLLSPASTWADFKNLKVIINTPYYMIDNSIDGFVKNDEGYTACFNSLPKGELEFTLCTVENPEPPAKTIYDYISAPIIRTIILSAVSVFAIFVLATIFRKIKR